MQYRPLAGDEIRLLRLLRNDPNGPIELSIDHYSLSGCPRYDALSYVWGRPPATATVLLAGKTVPVMTNLEAFLRQAVPGAPEHTSLLLPGPEVELLWIDALCIDQGNVPERNAQVMRMGNIYTRADRILVWLGPEDGDYGLGLAMDAMRNMSLSALDSRDEHLAAVVADQMGDGFRIAAVINLVQADYWRRAWIVQELTAPTGSPASRHGPVVWCSDRRMAWGLFSLATLRIYRYVAAASFARFQSILGGNDQWFDRVRRARLAPAAHPPLTMLRVLESTQGFEATDPRDMIYAFLALAVDGDHADLRPDYGRPVAEVYRRFAAHLIGRHDDGLDVLGHCLAPRKWATPSWVPDWTAQPLRPLVKRTWTRDGGVQAVYATSGTRKGNISFAGPVMSVDGLVVGRVAEVAPPRSYEKLVAVKED
jgi:hypothetical protein